MSGVEELVAAAKLNRTELKALRRALARMDQHRPDNRFNLDGFSVSLTRLSDDDFAKLKRRSIAIREDTMFLTRLMHPSSVWSEDAEERERLNLAELRFVLEHIWTVCSTPTHWTRCICPDASCPCGRE